VNLLQNSFSRVKYLHNTLPKQNNFTVGMNKSDENRDNIFKKTTRTPGANVNEDNVL